MARQRKPVNQRNNETSSSSGSETSNSKRTFRGISSWKTMLGFLCLAVAVYVGTLGYLETRVNTPFDDHKVVQKAGLAVPELYWGTYRPGVYMGMRSREPSSPIFGLMWYELTSHKGVRHWCDQNDNLSSYGWIRHDGVNFGEQNISDPPYTLVTSFVKSLGGEYGGHWTVRVNVTAQDNAVTPFALVWYGALDETRSSPHASQARLWIDNGVLHGHSEQLNNFKVTVGAFKGKILHKSFSEAHAPGVHLLKEKLFSLLRVDKRNKYGRVPVLGPDDEIHNGDITVNFVPIQLLVETPFVMDIVYTTEDYPEPPLKGDTYSKALEEKKKMFDKEFEDKFKLSQKGYSDEDVAIAKAGMSNMIGGVGYFYGSSRVRSQYTKDPVPYWKAALYTGVPSRSFFPRGFLWDEGFHGLLIGRWNPDIQLEIASHWLDLINVEGWIPREQILGAEALARVPKEFVVQSNAAANPPMLLVQLARLVVGRPELFQSGGKHRSTLDRMFPRLQAWYQWFQNTQKGEELTSYRWRGREDDGLQLNPKTLTSGLDDYPRASHPSSIERHVDLRCWMYAAADALTTIADVLERDSSKFKAIRDQLSDEEVLNELHWSPHTKTYADYGLHTDGVRLVKQKVQPPEQPRTVRAVTTPPTPRLVTSAYGYVSLFPMLLKVLRPASAKLGKLLEDLDKPDLLWSPYGLSAIQGIDDGGCLVLHLASPAVTCRAFRFTPTDVCDATFIHIRKQMCRSLSKSSPLYMKRNTEHDPPYWRGQVWLNINYLALSALKHYASAVSPHAARARELHARLRENIVGNILAEYKRTGYFWEQYSGEDGKGSGCKPFTGWTALLALIMAEEY